MQRSNQSSSLTVSNNQIVILPERTWVIALVWVDGFLDGTRTCDHVSLPCRIETVRTNDWGGVTYHAFIPALGKVKAIYPDMVSQVLNLGWAQQADSNDVVRVLATTGTVYTGRVIGQRGEHVVLELNNFSRRINIPRWQIIDRYEFAIEYDNAFSEQKASA